MEGYISNEILHICVLLVKNELWRQKANSEIKLNWGESGKSINIYCSVKVEPHSLKSMETVNLRYNSPGATEFGSSVDLYQDACSDRTAVQHTRRFAHH